MKILHAYYDLRAAPLSFDFIWYLAVASARAEQQDAKLSVTIFAPSFRKSNFIEAGFDEGYQLWKLNNVLVKAAHLCTRVVEVSVIRANRLRLDEPRFPEDYHPNTVDLSSGLTRLPMNHHDLDAAMMGARDRVIYRSTSYADAWAQRVFGGRKAVLMNLRTTGHNAPRNTPLDVWHKIYQRISAAGYHCVVVPDQDDFLGARAYEKYEWNVIGEASLDLDLRIALYRNAFATVTWAGGATSPLLVCGATFLMFGIWNEPNPVSNKNFFERKGPRFGVQPPWFHPVLQRYDWSASADVTEDYVVDMALNWLAEVEKTKVQSAPP